jgi:CelD/BcsL family acetyltransferase involved in cellulose biosynthesis
MQTVLIDQKKQMLKNLSIKRIEDTDSFSLLQNKWDELLRTSQSNSIFLSWAWLHTWWSLYGENRKLYILIVEDKNGDLIAVLPLLKKTVRSFLFTYTVLEFIGTGENRVDKVCSEYMDCIVKKGREKEVADLLAQYIIDNSKEWDMIKLEIILDDAVIKEIVSQLEKKYKRGLLNFTYTLSGYNILILPNTWQEYLAKLNSHRRNEVIRLRKNLNRFGETSIRSCSDEVFSNANMPAFIGLHQLRWRKCGLLGAFSSKAFTHFHKLLSGTLVKQRALLLTFLDLNNKPVACEYGFIFKEKLFAYQCGFDTDIPSCASLGSVLTSYIIEDSISQGIKEIHFLRGEGLHKDRWSHKKLSVSSIVVAKKNIKGFVNILSVKLYFDIKQNAKKAQPFYQRIVSLSRLIKNKYV